MRTTNRRPFDWSKPFKLVSSKKQFDELDTDESLVINVSNEESTAEPQVIKKQNIITPKIETVERITKCKPFAKITPNYIRLPSRLNLPKLNHYELTQVEHVFLQGQIDKFKVDGQTVLTEELLQSIFIELQTKAGKDNTIPRNKGWLMSYLQRQHKDILKMDNVEQFAQTIYNFWKNRRQELKFPLLRTLWKPNPDEYSHLLAFKTREKEKRNLRRANRIDEDQILQQLHDQFELALRITDRIQMREELKMKQVQLQMHMFNNDCKAMFGQIPGLMEITHEDRAMDKEKLKKFHQNLQTVKNNHLIADVVNDTQLDPNTFDQKMSVANFLSTVVDQASKFGINYEKIFTSGINRSIEATDAIKKITDPFQTPEECLNISLHKTENMVFRTFENSNEFKDSLKRNQPYADYCDFKRRRVSCYYFGSDDEGDYKDLKKNISASFKKFQQMNKIINQ